jgi:hypothetical protein
MDDLDTALWILRVVPPPWLWLAILVVPLAAYVAARARASRDQIVDPQLGLKVALSFFALVALQVLLAGTAMFMYAILSTSDQKSDIYKVALGLIVPAGIVLGVHLALLVRTTNQVQFPMVRRLFAGTNVLITGLLGFGALVLACEAAFNGHKWSGAGRIGGSGVIVYGSAWAVLVVKLFRMVDATPAPPSAPQASAAATSGGEGSHKPGSGLPPLGKGAFPPIQ